jgi:hypothetical protein
MELGSTVRRATKVVAGAAAALTAAAALALPGAEASGDATIVVRGASLPSGGRSQLNLVGCSSVFGRTAEAIAPMVGIAPGGPAGKRSLAFDLGGGNAVGPVSYVDNVAAVTVAGVSVYAPSGTSGVAYVGYQPPEDAGTTLMWIGRADVYGAAGQWTSVDVRGLGYTWTQYDMSTHAVVAEVGSSGIPAFVQAMGGAGAGFFAIGFGCDGNAFNTDAWRIGSSDGTTTYDFEGFTTKTTINGPKDAVEPRTPVTLTGHVDGPAGRVVLEAKQEDGTWDTVDVAPGPNPSAVVRPTETTTYRWRFFDRPAYEGSVSEPFTVQVAQPDDPSEPPTGDPTEDPTGEPTAPPSDEPTAPASSEAPADPAVESTPPADTPTPDPTPEVVEPPVEPPTDQPTADPLADPPAGEQATAPADSAEVSAG